MSRPAIKVVPTAPLPLRAAIPRRQLERPISLPFQGIGIFTNTNQHLELTNGTVPPNAYKYIGVHWNIGPAALEAIRDIHTEAHILAYQNFGGMIAGPHTNDRPTSLVTQEEAATHGTGADDWRLRLTSDGTVATFCDFTFLAWAHPGLASYQAQAANHFPAIARDGYDGVMFDDVNPQAGHCWVDGFVTRIATEVDYRAHVIAGLHAIAPAAQAAGLTVVPNFGLDPWNTNANTAYVTMLADCDMFIREFWQSWDGLDPTPFTGAAWELTAQMLVDAEQRGVAGVLNMYSLNPADHTRSIRYGLASMYVWSDGVSGSAFGYNGLKPLASFGQYPPTIGRPIEAKQLVPTKTYAYSRRHAAGIAIVNAEPSAGLITFNLNGTYIDPDGNRVSSVQLDSGHGMVLTRA